MLEEETIRAVWQQIRQRIMNLSDSSSLAVPLQCVPEAADDGGAVRASDGFPLGAADVVQDVVASLHRHLNPRGSLGMVQRPGGGGQVLDMHVVFP